MRVASLRTRLILVILPPLVAVAALAGAWQLSNARATAVEVHDRRLLLTALAVQYDVLLSDGEALGTRTRELLTGDGDGPIYYHVYAPDGAIVIGYATPPVGIPRSDEAAVPTFFSARYLGRPVHGVRLRGQGDIAGIAGRITTTVWQDVAARRTLVWTLMTRSLAVIGALIGSVALIVWFGVRRGLRPLADLEAAVARRSGDDLSPIARPVPIEVAGTVARLNALFAQVERTLAAQREFVANAAHQLRNPVAGILALADAVRRARDLDTARERAEALDAAARETAALTESLLLLERASAGGGALRPTVVSLRPLLAQRLSALALPKGVEAELRMPDEIDLWCDETMLGEAVANLLDNAVVHGGPHLRLVVLSAVREGATIRITVSDDGRGVREDEINRLTERFRQVEPGQGAGLGLSVVLAVVEGHGGTLAIRSVGGFEVSMVLPAERAPAQVTHVSI